MSKVLSLSSKGNLLKIEDLKETKGYIWYFMTEEVMKYVSSIGLTEGDIIEFKSEEIRGEDTIIYIKKQGGTVAEFKCIKCGKALKDGKYKTCYNCSMEAKEKEQSSPDNQHKQDSIEKQCALKASAKAVALVFQGRLTTPDELATAIGIVYDQIVKKFNS